MRVTKEKATAHRVAIVEAASRLFREQGFDGVGVAEIMKEAGLTHGGFYGHFKSKDALAAEACRDSFDAALSRIPRSNGAVPVLVPYVDRFLADARRHMKDVTCPMTSYVTDISRQSDAVQECFAQGFDAYIDTFADGLPGTEQGEATQAARRREAMLIVSAMVGGLSLARATAKTAPALAGELLAAVRQQVVALVTAVPDAERPS